jgi:REP element-mobilizing transposase RayT
MPNHIHALLRILGDHKLPDVVRSLKSFTAKRANKELEREGAFWQRDYYDRLIRTPKHLHWARKYIERNPRNLPSGVFTLYLK